MNDPVRPVVFLDIDGVLNNQGSTLALGSPSHVFDPVSVGLVARLCRETDARIVISSSWRLGVSMGALLDDMARCGAGALREHVIGATPDLSPRVQATAAEWMQQPTMPRGAEIQRWIEQSAFAGPYVILDDDSDMLPEQEQFFVKTYFEDGFRFEHFIRAHEILRPGALRPVIPPPS